jgi:hypothetical protein
MIIVWASFAGFPIALQVVTVREGVVRSALAEQQQEIAGRCAGHPKRRTAQPTTERVREAFNEIRLPIVSGPGLVQRYLPPLSALQQQIFALCGFSPVVYTRLTDDSSFWLVIEANREKVC